MPGLLNEYLKEREGEDMDGEETEAAQQDDTEDQGKDDNTTAMLQNCFTSIVNTLANSNARYVMLISSSI